MTHKNENLLLINLFILYKDIECFILCCGKGHYDNNCYCNIKVCFVEDSRVSTGDYEKGGERNRGTETGNKETD